MNRNPWIHVPDSVFEGLVQVWGSEAHHLLKVVRIRTGDRVTLFDGAGRFCLGEVSETGKGFVNVRLVEPEQSLGKPEARLTLFAGIVKGNRMDFAVEKAAEVGVDRLIPLITERSVVNPGDGKIKHWRRIALSAAKQSQNPWLMDVGAPCRIREAAQKVKDDLCVLMTLDPRSQPLSSLREVITGEENVSLFVGPEGGFSASEIESIRAALPDICMVTGGDQVLRTETAAVAGSFYLRVLMTEIAGLK